MNITEVLIKYYKDRGVSLEKVIDDPVFKSLPVQQQIAALKQHAADMQEGVKPNGVVSNSKTIALNVAKGIGAGAIGVGLNLLRQDSSTWEDKIFHSLAALGVGGLAGAINGTLQAVKDNNRKETSNQYLKQIAQKSGVDEATIRLLSSRGGYKPITPKKQLG